MKNLFNLTNEQTERWMRILLNRSNEVGRLGEVPVSAIVLDGKGRCIGHGSNRKEWDKNPFGHAEIIAIKQASLIKKDWRLNDCTLIVTLEPCPMCASAIIQARIGKVIYGASDTKRGGLGGTIDLSIHKSAHHKMIVQKGVLEDHVSVQLKRWFKSKRVNS